MRRRFVLLAWMCACASSSPISDGTEIAPFNYALQLVVDRQTAYVIAESGTQPNSPEHLWRVDLDSGTVEQFPYGGAYLIGASDDEALYAGGARIPKDGSTPTNITNTNIRAVDDAYAYVMRPADGGVVSFARLPKTGGAEEVIIASAPDGIDSAVTVTDTHLYWAMAFLTQPSLAVNTTISRAPKDGGAFEVLSTNAGTTLITAAAGHVYWTENADGGIQPIVQFDEATHATSVATRGRDAAFARAILVAGDKVYWTPGSIIWGATIGSDSSKVAIHSNGDIVDLAVLDGQLYWLEYSGEEFGGQLGSLRVLPLPN